MEIYFYKKFSWKYYYLLIALAIFSIKISVWQNMLWKYHNVFFFYKSVATFSMKISLWCYFLPLWWVAILSMKISKESKLTYFLRNYRFTMISMMIWHWQLKTSKHFNSPFSDWLGRNLLMMNDTLNENKESMDFY